MWDNFFAFLTEREGLPDNLRGSASAVDPTRELRQDLRHWGVNVDRLESRVAEIVSRGKQAQARSWIQRASQAQAAFEERIRNKTKWISDRLLADGPAKAAEIWQSIAAGALGPSIQQHATV